MHCEHCEHCPLIGTGKACPSKDYPSYCRHVVNELGQAYPYWTGLLLKEADQPPKPIPRKIPTGALVLRGICNAYSGYGQHLQALGQELEKLGHAVVIDCVDGDDNRFLPMTEWTKNHRTEVKYEGPVFQSLSPGSPLHAGDVCLTMWETTQVPEVENLDRCRAVIVPCEANKEWFLNSGVSVPIRVIPLGYDTNIFKPKPKGLLSSLLGRPKNNGIVRFGCAGRTAHGGVRKGLDQQGQRAL